MLSGATPMVRGHDATGGGLCTPRLPPSMFGRQGTDGASTPYPGLGPAAAAAQTASRPQLPDIFTMAGFKNQQYNENFYLNRSIQVESRPTYWTNSSSSSSLFLYYQASEARWVLSPQIDMSGQDMLREVQRGDIRGVAFETQPGVWQEYVDGSWQVSTVHMAAKAKPAEPQHNLLQQQMMMRQRPLQMPTQSRSSEIDTVVMQGFSNKALDGTYLILKPISIGGRSTYWEASRQHFMYYQSSERRWAISRHSSGNDNSFDMLLDARNGGMRGLAFEAMKGSNNWKEFVGDSWESVKLRMERVVTGQRLPPDFIPPQVLQLWSQSQPPPQHDDPMDKRGATDRERELEAELERHRGGIDEATKAAKAAEAVAAAMAARAAGLEEQLRQQAAPPTHSPGAAPSSSGPPSSEARSGGRGGGGRSVGGGRRHGGSQEEAAASSTEETADDPSKSSEEEESKPAQKKKRSSGDEKIRQLLRAEISRHFRRSGPQPPRAAAAAAKKSTPRVRKRAASRAGASETAARRPRWGSHVSSKWPRSELARGDNRDAAAADLANAAASSDDEGFEAALQAQAAMASPPVEAR